MLNGNTFYDSEAETATLNLNLNLTNPASTGNVAVAFRLHQHAQRSGQSR
jgi:hypothetical protein